MKKKQSSPRSLDKITTTDCSILEVAKLDKVDRRNRSRYSANSQAVKDPSKDFIIYPLNLAFKVAFSFP